MIESIERFVKWCEDVPASETNGLIKLRDDAPDNIKKETHEYDDYFFKHTGRHKIFFGK